MERKTNKYLKDLLCERFEGGMIYATPFDNIIVPFAFIVTYLIVIAGLHQWMKNRNAFQLSGLLAAHNFFLCGLSILMAVGTAGRMLRVYFDYGAYHVYCGTFTEEDEKLLLWSNLFYLSKFYELLDTVFVVLRKKPLTVLHVWHHTSVVYVCWLANQHQIVMGWMTCFQNSAIHIIMYYYYGQQVRGGII